MTYRAGELDQRVKVMRLVRTPDGYGGYDNSFAENNEYWCHVRPLSGRETVEADRLQGEATYLFVFRNGLDVRDADMLEWEGEQFNIRVRKQPKKRNLYIEIEAERGVAQ